MKPVFGDPNIGFRAKKTSVLFAAWFQHLFWFSSFNSGGDDALLALTKPFSRSSRSSRVLHFLLCSSQVFYGVLVKGLLSKTWFCGHWTIVVWIWTYDWSQCCFLVARFHLKCHVFSCSSWFLGPLGPKSSHLSCISTLLFRPNPSWGFFFFLAKKLILVCPGSSQGSRLI